MTSPRRGNPARSGGTALLGAVGLAGLLLVIELAPRLGLVDERYLPPASRIAAALAEEAGTPAFWTALTDTLIAWSVGLAIAVGAAVLAGIVIGSIPVLRSLTASTIEFLRPIPSVALIPLAVLMYGTELGSTLLLVCYAAFWQVLVQVLYGVADVDPVAFETARSFRFSAWGRIRHVLWPTALPYVFTGVRLAASVALVLAITAELVIGSPGLGKEIAVAQASEAVPTMYALIVVTGVLGVIINLLARTGERRLLAWHQSVRGEVTV
ncbi:ABC-type nitrate/sulfonate/bicarbonate transport system permease component [Actinoplanes campanulatus]|uniref:ABC-type nitrate/sulfonate/bicarbonate transport system permease component n=1 Tax=Actinoplanes campanulatus TaxID=113559 RepID=A0A7W5AFY7_9ACTN|nr:ABC transporter permease [Actinoplanes campanulatus]MBB3095347.1 ABC-type nitrate/sulfonate/bicarbonate transport system permease component [Actinoplanes campanulatus]GGN41646.1 nitrate ABC transporter permease [Actinoplanes campanulatus]GID34951.1 nitrate ABC transporter permease [Actinoplanes campanulatus]